MPSTPSPTTGSKTAGYVVCLVLAVPIALLLLPIVWGVVFSAGFLVTAFCIGAVWLLRERERARERD